MSSYYFPKLFNVNQLDLSLTSGKVLAYVGYVSNYYNPKRVRNLYDPRDSKPFRLSRSKIDLFINCPRCFYLDRRLGVAQPPGYPFSLNSAVDKLLKKEFDIHRADGTSHPLCKSYGIDVIPLAHEKIPIPP